MSRKYILRRAKPPLILLYASDLLLVVVSFPQAFQLNGSIRIARSHFPARNTQGCTSVLLFYLSGIL